MDTDPRTAAQNFLKQHRTGVLSTLSTDGLTPHARLVYYASDETFSIYFLTIASTRKAEELRVHPRAAFTVSSETVPQTMQIEGAVTDITDETTIDSTVSELFENLSSNVKYYAPLARMDQGDVRYYKLAPDWVRFGDFTEGHHTDQVMKEIVP